jgi:hypothetical protein
MEEKDQKEVENTENNGDEREILSEDYTSLPSEVYIG